MKQGPKLQSVQDNMRQGELAAYGFLGDDTRNLVDILIDDGLMVERLGVTHKGIAARLRELAGVGLASQGRPIVVGEDYEVVAEEHKGMVPCPFRDNHRSPKLTVTVTHRRSGRQVHWSDLNVHMIEEHGFYEGRGADYRLDPETLVDLLHITQSSSQQTTRER